MKAKIETYRGIDIEFDTTDETFICIIDEYNRKEKKSYSSIKKSIDEYKSTNKDFKPFPVIAAPNGYGGIESGVQIITGVRKDGRFVYQNSKGEKKQISDYNEKDILLYKPEMEVDLVNIAYLQTLADDAEKKVYEAKKSFKGTTLLEYKKTLEL